MASPASTTSVPSSSEVEEMMVVKARDLFSLCDKEKKGFMTKRDMQRLQTELPLTPDQLEAVFDSLDENSNGYLTLDEFIEGFGSFRSVESSLGKENLSSAYVDQQNVPDPESEHFEEMVTTMGAQGMFEDVDTIKSLWIRLNRDEPELVGNFEAFLTKVTGEIKRSHQDFQTLESALRNKNTSHDEEVRKLYEEMEQQIKLEKERIMVEEKAREKQLRDEMEKELKVKDQQLQDMLLKHHEMEQKLHELNTQEAETKHENEKLAKTKTQLEDMLSYSQRHLEDSRTYINDLKHKQRQDKRERAMSALQMSEGIALERESLVQQLDMLRDMNRKLRDERDEATSRYIDKRDQMLGCDTCESDVQDVPLTQSPYIRTQYGATHKSFNKQGSVLSDYVSTSKNSTQGLETNKPRFEGDDEVRYKGGKSRQRRGRRPETSDSEMDEDFSRRQRRPTKSKNGRLSSAPTSGESELDASSHRREPVGAQDVEDFVEEDLTGKAPERVFKVVFVGDSGVGKSSFIHRFCSNVFKGTFSATIGVDFQVRNLRVDEHIIALQLWDTAGQERFRSITKQYFRKADGVLIMYDVTSESSFRNVRNWMMSVQDGVEDGTVLTLVGNKMDLVEDEEGRPITTKDGVRLADEYGSLFYETSAKSGSNVTDALNAMASLLREREDKQLQSALNLTEQSSKKGCCG